MPSGNDNITGFSIPQMINASLGQGLLNIGTANAIFTLQVPVTRADWIAADSTNSPQVNVIQQSNGFVNDWSCVGVNGDIWFQSSAGDIRSLLTAVRYFQQWGNVDISSNEDQVLSLINTALLNYASGIYWNNYLLMTSLPTQTPYGVVHPVLIPLDFTPISSLEEQDPPEWLGQLEGQQIFKLSTVQYQRVPRAFAVTLNSTIAGQIELWEIVKNQNYDIGVTGQNRIQWQIVSPGFTWAEHPGFELELKKLVSGELWVDQLQGAAQFLVEYSPDGSNCWYKWHAFTICSAVDSSQITPEQGYPLIIFQPGKRRPLVLPLPPDDNDTQDNRPANVAFEIQVRLTILGQVRLRALLLKGELVQRPLYEGLVE
jgi:hypothetical protein